ncbi:glycosyltransferase [Pseudoroseicyclus sp. CXY001]|uniref:glycosyltransferase n=1 Tax=Pseudoroseicyclus sp. CXY001 TaxID=3242492 RepID=UPI0035709ADA
MRSAFRRLGSPSSLPFRGRPSDGDAARIAPPETAEDEAAIRAEFDAGFYRSRHPELAGLSDDALCAEYCRTGWQAGRDPAPGFSTAFYLGANPDVREAGINPFAHWIVDGREEGRPGLPAAEPPPPPAQEESEDALRSIEAVRALIRPEFDAEFYREAYPELALEPAEDLLTDYCAEGWQAGRDPAPDFSTTRYLAHNPDVLEAGINPFAHWILFGRLEERLSAPSAALAERRDQSPYEMPALFTPIDRWSAAEDAGGRTSPQDLWAELAPDFPYGIPAGQITAPLVLFHTGASRLRARRIREALLVTSGPVIVLLPEGVTLPEIDAEGAGRVRAAPASSPPTAADLAACLGGLEAEELGLWDGRLCPAVSAWRFLEHSLRHDDGCGAASPALIGQSGLLWRSGAELGRDGARAAFRDAGAFCLEPMVFRQRPSALADPAMALYRLGPLRDALAGVDGTMPLLDALTRASAGLAPVTQGCALALSPGVPPRPETMPELSPAALERLERPGERIVFVDSVPPMPDQDAGSVTAWNFLEIFRERGAEILFYSTSRRAWDDRYLLALTTRGIIGLTDKCVADYNLACDLIARTSPAAPASLTFVLTRVHAGGEVFERTRALFPQGRIIFNTVDLHGLRELREAQLLHNTAAEFLAQGTIARERQVIRMSDATILLSEAEMAALTPTLGYANLRLIPMINELRPPVAGFAERRGLLFIGGFAHFPNRDAVEYMIEALWAPLRARLPDVTLELVGPHFPQEMAARLPDGVTAAGFVEDLPAKLETARLTIAPLRYGAGIKGKIGTSLGHGVPCVATSLAAEGMGLEEGKEILIADAPEAFADAVARLYTDETLWARASQAGYAFCEARYSRRAVALQMNALLDDVAS